MLGLIGVFFLQIEPHVQVTVQLVRGLFAQQRRSVSLCQLRDLILVDQLDMIGVDAELQRRTAADTGFCAKHRVQITVCCAVRKADIPVSVQQLTADGFDQRIGQILGAGLLLHLHIRLRAGLYQRDSRKRKQRQQHHADNKLDQRCPPFVFQHSHHGVPCPPLVFDWPLL